MSIIYFIYYFITNRGVIRVSHFFHNLLLFIGGFQTSFGDQKLHKNVFAKIKLYYGLLLNTLGGFFCVHSNITINDEVRGIT